MGKTVGIQCPNCAYELKISIESKKSPAIERDKLFAEDVFMTFPIDGGGGDYFLGSSQVEKWQSQFPHLNVPGEMGKALGWLEANPNKRKTLRGMPRFLHSWLCFAQNKGLRSPQTKEEMKEALDDQR